MKTKLSKKKLICIIIAVLMMAGLLIWNDERDLTETQKITKIERFVKHKDMLGLFKHAYQLGKPRGGMTDDISDPVERILISCCKTKDQAIQFAKDNGFVFGNFQPYSVLEPSRNNEHYDEMVIAVKHAGHYFIISWRYRLVLYFRNGEVISTKALVFSDSL